MVVGSLKKKLGIHPGQGSLLPVSVLESGALAHVQQTMRKCVSCTELAQARTQVVPGVGAGTEPLIALVGEAPSAADDAEGRPFSGPSGVLLGAILDALSVPQDAVYYANTLGCRPPDNRPPSAQELDTCRGYLHQQLRIIRPRVILCLGGVAGRTLLKKDTGVTGLRQTVYRWDEYPVVVTYHPSWLLRKSGKELAAGKRAVWADFQLALRTAQGSA